MREKNLPKVSVVVCTKNEAGNIGRLLESLKNQTYPSEKVEVIVVDNQSTDGTRRIALEYTDRVYNIADERDLSRVKNVRGAQLNFGVAKSSGEIIFYPDADMTFNPDLLGSAIKTLKEFDALYVPEVIVGRGFFGEVRNFERSFYVGTCIDAVRFVTRRAFEEVGGFDEVQISFGFDDWDFTQQLKREGCRFGIAPKNLYHHEGMLHFKDYLSKKLRYAQTVDDYVQKWGDDPDIRRQFSPGYRFLGVFIGEGKWRRLLAKPHLGLGLLFLRLMVGFTYLWGKFSPL